MTKHRVVVEVDLGVDREKLPFLRDHQRIDLRQRRVRFQGDFREVHHQLGSFAGHLIFEAQLVGEIARLISLQAQKRMKRLLQHFFRRLPGDLFDIHAALCRGDHRDRVAAAIDGDSQVIFPGDVDAGRDDQHRYGHALRPGLIAGHAIVQHELRRRPRLFSGFDQLDEARLSAPACVHLRLHNAHWHVELLERRRCLIDRANDLGGRNGNACIGENLTRLIFVNFHRMQSVVTGERSHNLGGGCGCTTPRPSPRATPSPGTPGGGVAQ